jgi:hypothetical protein
MPTTVLTAATEAQLDADIAQANAAASGAVQINVTSNISESADPTQIKLQSGVTLTIDGSNGAGGENALDGSGAYRGLFVYSGMVTIEDLVIQNATAAGSAGAGINGGPGSGGGGAGLGGGLFVASSGTVTLRNVNSARMRQ